MELSAILQTQQAEAAQIADQAVPNGVASTSEAGNFGTLANGDGSHISPYTESALPIPPMSQDASQLSSAPPLLEEVAQASNNAIDIDAPVQDDTLALTTVASSTVPAVWQAHNLDIDIVSLKLSKHKYLTPSDFLADIAKIEENADKLGDPDRITRIGEMGAHARMHVMNFDPAWEPRFEAYAERVRDRKVKRQKEKEERKRLEAGEVVPQLEETNGQGGGDGVVVPTEGAVGADTGLGVGGVKRSREDGEDRDDERKRLREDIEMDGSSLAAPAPIPIPVPTAPDITITPATAANPAGSDPTNETTSIDLSSTMIERSVEQATVPPPRVIYPPFVLPSDSLLNLQTRLVHGTSRFTIEELEQLRAACFDKIWRHRADWDRTACVKGVQGVVDDFIIEVDEANLPEED